MKIAFYKLETNKTDVLQFRDMVKYIENSVNSDNCRYFLILMNRLNRKQKLFCHSQNIIEISKNVFSLYCTKSEFSIYDLKFDNTCY